MAIRISQNIGALTAQRNLSGIGQALGRSFERLSSGLRINRASDDPAGLAVASALQTEARLSSQALRNINDGISMLAIAEGALHELSNIVLRQQELAQQAANGTLNSSQRQAMDREANALVDEFNRIVATTEFNGQRVLQPNSVTIQAGTGSTDGITVRFGEELARAVGTGQFTAGQSSATSWTPVSIVVGDLDGDGNDDFVTANDSADSLSVLLGNGDGTFDPRVDLSTGAASTPAAVTLSDVDGDGDLDILSANYDTNDLSLFRGNGDGTFQAEMSIATGAHTAYVTAGDFDGNGTIDLVSADATDNTVSVLLGNGTYGARMTFATGSNPVWIAAKDVNNDQILDLMTTDFAGGSSVSILLGNGDGTFQNRQSVAIAAPPRSITADDFNRDGLVDLAVVDNGNQVSVLLNGGGGEFTVASATTVGISPTCIISGDVNGDGIPDLVYNEYTSGTFSVQLGNGDGTFDPRTSSSTSTSPRAVALGDFNGDGAPDVVVAEQGTDTATVFLAATTQSSSAPYLNLSTQAGALAALESLAVLQEHVGAELGSIGASQSRLEHAMSNVAIARENFAAAASRITDVDIAEEAANLVRLQILQQGAAAVLAQANQEPALALKLLRG